MNAQDLKNSILQLAIQGKLVSQEKEHGTAEELYTQIQEEKSKLISEGKIKKTQELSEINEDEVPFDLPYSWMWVRLDSICEYIQRGKSPKYSDIKKYPVVSQKCNQWSGFSLEKAKFIEPDTISKYQKERFLVDGDLMWNSTGTGTLGRVAIYEENKNPYELAVADSHVTVIRPLKKHINYKYLYYYIANPSVQKVIEEQSSGSTKQIELATKTVKNYIVPLPPLDEQKLIVEKIEELMPYVDQYGKTYSKLEELNKKFPEDMQKSILQYAIQGKLVEQRQEEGTAEELYQMIQEEKKRLIEEGKIKKTKALPEISEDEIQFDIPESWKWVRLGDIFKINPRNTLSDDTNVSFIPMTLIEDGYKSEFSFEKRPWGKVKKGYTHFSEGDIVMAKITPCFQNLKSAIMKDLENGYGAGTTELHVLRPFNDDLTLEYFLWFIKSPIFVSTCIKKMTGTAGQQRVGTDIITNYIVPLPPAEEQKRIVDKIEELLPYTKQLVK
ncbi:restriction endonuclease subunit S [Bacillus velezensis]|uniref:restriction endonuclease subunit S n=1 Tax=Bacillus velezensis TaxID=492670 RepID=UPI001CC9E983|nr:restriction endonuclease subunit S [Bacillus velezensis]